jgi:hypothetical protein
LAAGNDEPRPLEHADVLHHGAAIERPFEPSAKFPRRARPLLEKVQDIATTGIRQRLEHEVVGFAS